MFKIATQKHRNGLRAGDARDLGFLELLGARADIAVPGVGGARTYPALLKSFLWPSKIGLGNGIALESFLLLLHALSVYYIV